MTTGDDLAGRLDRALDALDAGEAPAAVDDAELAALVATARRLTALREPAWPGAEFPAELAARLARELGRAPALGAPRRPAWLTAFPRQARRPPAPVRTLPPAARSPLVGVARRLLSAAALVLLLALVGAALALVVPGMAHRVGRAPVAGGGNTGRVVLVSDEDAAAGGQMYPLSARPVAPATLAGLPGYAPIGVGHHYTYAVSPDGRTLAMFIWPSGSNNAGGVLHLIDLGSWTDTDTSVTVDDSVPALSFSPDGRSLYWCLPGRHDPAHDIGRDFVLYRYDFGSRAPSAVVILPTSFIPGTPRVLDGGKRIALYGVPTDANNLTVEVPHVLLIDVAARRIATDVRLDGVKAGQFYIAKSTDMAYQEFFPGLAWDLRRGRLYVAHADEDRITVVDLAAGRILAQADIRPRESLLGRLARWLVPAAEAKGNGGQSGRGAFLSPDGARLYLVGQRTEPLQSQDGSWRWQTTTLPLQVIDTRDLREVQRLAVPQYSSLWFSPNRERVVGVSIIVDHSAPAGSPPRGYYRLTIYDGRSLKELGHVDVAGSDSGYDSLTVLGFSSDGRHAYVNYSRWTNAGATPARWDRRLQVLDLETQRVVAERPVDGTFWDLITVAPRESAVAAGP